MIKPLTPEAEGIHHVTLDGVPVNLAAIAGIEPGMEGFIEVIPTDPYGNLLDLPPVRRSGIVQIFRDPKPGDLQ